MRKKTGRTTAAEGGGGGGGGGEAAARRKGTEAPLARERTENGAEEHSMSEEHE